MKRLSKAARKELKALRQVTRLRDEKIVFFAEVGLDHDVIVCVHPNSGSRKGRYFMESDRKNDVRHEWRSLTQTAWDEEDGHAG